MPLAFKRAHASALVAALTVGALVPLTVAAPADAAGRRLTVPYAKPGWAQPGADRGVTPASATVEFAVGLELQPGAEAFAAAVSTPGSPQYRHYLTPSAWIARFSPTKADMAAVVAALTAAGLTITDRPASREYLVGRGTADAVQGFFRTSLHRYAVQGRTRTAATTSPTLPAPVADSVARVTFDRPVFVSSAVPASRTSLSPCSAYYGQHRVAIPAAYGKRTASTPLCGYTAKQLRAVYGLDGRRARAYRGSGQTIAVLDAYGAPSMRRDLATFSARNGLPQASYRQLVAGGQRHQAECDPAAWQVEQALDLEAAHAVAPKARLLYVGARDCGFGMDLALSRILDGGLATIVSNSWGSLSEDPNADALRIPQHLQAAGQGIGLYFASGDIGDGAEYLGAPTAGFPASSPWVTAVGGTATALDRRNRIVFSTGWGDSFDWTTSAAPNRWALRLPGQFLGGAGGGVSDEFGMPAYQRGVVPTSVSGGRRAFSDVAALASPETGLRIGLRPTGTSTFRTLAVGGTSLATPIVAAEMAIAQQRGRRVLGFVNPALYRLARIDSTALRDVRPSLGRRIMAVRSGTTAGLFTMDRDSSLRLRKGYDVVTGVGELTATSIARLATR